MEYIRIVKQRVQSSCLSTRSLDVATPVFTPTPPTREPVSRLPKLNLPTFSGDTLMWQTFRDSFDAAAHNCPSLNEIQKFNYVRAQLHGDASRTIAGLPLTGTNYDNGIELLTKKYGQPDQWRGG